MVPVSTRAVQLFKRVSSGDRLVRRVVCDSDQAAKELIRQCALTCMLARGRRSREGRDDERVGCRVVRHAERTSESKLKNAPRRFLSP